MNRRDLRIEFETYKGQFKAIKEQIEVQVVKIENYKGYFYEIFPYSYQRMGIQTGKPVKDMNRIKSTNRIITYGFNSTEQIVEVKEGIDLKDRFYYQFLFYENTYIKSLDFSYDDKLMNISFYLFDENKKIKQMYSQGSEGGMEETYYYNEDGILEKIIVTYFDKEHGVDTGIAKESFQYHEDGSLKTIIRSDLEDTSQQIIYKSK